MTDEDPDIFDELFGDASPATVSDPPPAPALVEGEASAKLGRNLDLALERQGEILSQPLTPATDAREKRIVADVAHQVVRAAVSVDANRLQERNKDTGWSETLAEVRALKAVRDAKLEERRRLQLNALPAGHANFEIP